MNREKFGVKRNVVKYSDRGKCRGWEFMGKRIEEYGEKVVVMIDEGDGGGKGNEIGREMSMMEKFVVGWEGREYGVDGIGNGDEWEVGRIE